MIKVYSKNKLSEKTRELVGIYINSELIQKLNAGLKEEIHFTVDSKIIAGIRIDINSEIIDLTINSRLEKILDQISKVN